MQPRRSHRRLRVFFLGSLIAACLIGCHRQAAMSAAPSPAPAATPAQARDNAQTLRFDIVEGRIHNAFYRRGRVSAHLLLRSGSDPRLLAAFPAGNSGVGLWFEPTERPAQWILQGELRGIKDHDAENRPLYGIEAEAAVDAPHLTVREAVLGNVRVLRDYQALGRMPEAVRTSPKVEDGRRVVWARPRIDGAAGYTLSLEAVDGAVSGGGDAPLVFTAPAGKPLRVRLRALSGDTPLTPLPLPALLDAGAGSDERSREVLQFLSYEEKFLAGSWRFNTYFGRDTLMSLRLLLPALAPEAMEAGLGSVLVRLDDNGEVAHEEDLSEFALLRRREEGAAPSADPIYDYKMVDDDFMLAPVAAAYLLETPEGRERAAVFLDRKTPEGERYRAALARNLAWVVEAAAPFARAPEVKHLIVLKGDYAAGQWRDSDDGLGDGRYAYDVNAVFVPAALAAVARFVESGLLEEALSPEQSRTLANAAAYADAWRKAAPPLFVARRDPANARRAVAAYAKAEGVDPAPALAALPAEALTFNAIALDAAGKPIPVLHSDDGFALLFETPPAADVERSVSALMRPFPAGLMTDVGLLVANPVFAGDDLQRRLGRNAYHGTVVWSWQQALLAAGLERQLAREDLPASTRAQLQGAQASLWHAIQASNELRTSELWSWSQQDGRYRMEPFGQRGGDADESNAAQLWSTVFLALAPLPAADARQR